MDFYRSHRNNDPAMTLDLFCKEYCQSRIEDAAKFLEENDMPHAYLRLAEVLKKDHKSEKHKDMKKKALYIVITSLGTSVNPGIRIFYSNDTTMVIVTISYKIVISFLSLFQCFSFFL